MRMYGPFCTERALLFIVLPQVYTVYNSTFAANEKNI